MARARFRLPDGAELHVEETSGEGTPIVLLHGVLASSADWRPVAERLARAGRRVALVDDRGHGASSPPTPGMDWGPRAAAADVRRLLEARYPDGVHLVGHSRGATVATWVAVEAPALVRSLANVASPPEASEVFRALQRRALAALPADAPAWKREALAQLAGLGEDDFPTHALRRYPGAALVVEAGQDAFYSPTQTLFWRAYLPYAAFERYEGGHGFLTTPEGAAWLAERLLRHVEDAEDA